MSRLTAKERNALPDSTFAGPDRSFPIPDKAHAIAAERLVGRAKDLTPAQKAKIRAAAKRKLRQGSARKALY